MASPNPITLTERDIVRFWALVNKAGPIPAHRPELGPCWIRGRLLASRDTYSGFMVRGIRFQSHCVSIYLATGRWPQNQGCHHCDRRQCVNPAHLFDGTQGDNLADMHAKGRGPIQRGRPKPGVRGEAHWTRRLPDRIAIGARNGTAKLDEGRVALIRRDYATGGVSMLALGRRFGVSAATVHRIVHVVLWKPRNGGTRS